MVSYNDFDDKVGMAAFPYNPGELRQEECEFEAKPGLCHSFRQLSTSLDTPRNRDALWLCLRQLGMSVEHFLGCC